MHIKLPHMPFKFDSPEGRMEITVRPRSSLAADPEPGQHFGAAVTFLQPGPRALERIPLSPRSNSYSEVMQTLKEGFKVNPGSHGKDSIEFRVLTALCAAEGVIDLNAI